MARKTLTAEERFLKFKDEERKAHRNIVKGKLSDNERFTGMADAFKRAKRYLREATNLCDEVKFEEQRAKIQERLDNLEAKRAIAQEAHTNLTSMVERQETIQEELAKSLVALLNDGKFPNDPDVLNGIIDEVLTDVDIDSVSSLEDPFSAFRANREETTTED